MTSPLSAGPDAIYNNMGEGNRYDWIFFQKTPPWVDITALRFRATGSGALDSILLPVAVEPAHLPLSIILYADVEGKPGVVLESWAAEVPLGLAPAPTRLNSKLQPLLAAEEHYWVAVIPALPATVIWHRNSRYEPGGHWCGCSLDGLLHIAAHQMMPAIQVIPVDGRRTQTSATRFLPRSWHAFLPFGT